MGGTALCEINKSLTEKGYLLYLTGLSRGLKEDLIRACGDKWKDILECLFPSIQDALSALEHQATSPVFHLNGKVLDPSLIQQGVRESSV